MNTQKTICTIHPEGFTMTNSISEYNRRDNILTGGQSVDVQSGRVVEKGTQRSAGWGRMERDEPQRDRASGGLARLPVPVVLPKGSGRPAGTSVMRPGYKELHYQNATQDILDTDGVQWGLAGQVFSEGFSNTHNDVLQQHRFIIEKDLLVGTGADGQVVGCGIRGLRSMIAELNSGAIQSFLKRSKVKRTKLTVDDVVSACVAHFISLHDESDAFGRFASMMTENDYLPGPMKRVVELAGEAFFYNTIYFEDPADFQNKNNIVVIREKRIHPKDSGFSSRTGQKTHERSDFSVYINGVPLILAEIKTEDSGLQEALLDRAKKSSYPEIPLFLISNGLDAGLVSNPAQLNIQDKETGASVYLWTNHTRMMVGDGSREMTGFEHLISQLVGKTENLMLYLRNCVILDFDNRALKNARVQQFGALRAAKDRLKQVLARTRNGQPRKPDCFGVVHTQRTGKTVTMRLIAALALMAFGELYDTVIFYAPDLTILDLLVKEMNQLTTGGKTIRVRKIESRKAYRDMVEEIRAAGLSPQFSGGAQIFIVNMQKISSADEQAIQIAPYLGHNVLAIVDEAHVAQTGSQAGTRDTLFPNASHLVVTATPKEETYRHYLGADPSAVLDTFTYTQAVDAEIIVPVHFITPGKGMGFSEAKLMAFSGMLDNQLANAIRKELKTYADPDDDVDEDTQKAVSQLSKPAARLAIKKLWDELMPERLRYMAQFHHNVANDLTVNGIRLFKNKSSVYTVSQKACNRMISYIQEQERLDYEALNGPGSLPKDYQFQNTYMGLRFGVDYSGMDDATCQRLNPGIASSDLVEAAFRRQTPANGLVCIDILLVVDKYTKGYDLPELVTVFIDKPIREPSLINQIFTRPATKRPGKTIGYCVNLSWGDTTKTAFHQSVQMYDDADISNQIFSEEQAWAMVTSFAQHIETLCDALGLNPNGLTQASILTALLGQNIDRDVRFSRQTTFVAVGRKVFQHIAALRSPRYFAAYKIQIAAIYDAFRRFGEIYAHKDAGFDQIAINLDRSVNRLFVNTQDILDAIKDVLSIMQEPSLATLLEISYNDIPDMPDDDRRAQEGAIKAAIENRKRETNYDALTKSAGGLGAGTAQRNPSLLTELQKLMDKIGDDCTVTHHDDTQKQIRLLQEQVQHELLLAEQTVVRSYGGSYFRYALTEGLVAAFTRKAAVGQADGASLAGSNGQSDGQTMGREGVSADMVAFVHAVALKINHTIEQIRSAYVQPVLGLSAGERLAVLTQHYKREAQKNALENLMGFVEPETITEAHYQDLLRYKAVLSDAGLLERLIESSLKSEMTFQDSLGRSSASLVVEA